MHFLVCIEHAVVFVEHAQKVVVCRDFSWLQLRMDLKSVEFPLQLSELLLPFLGAWV